MSGWRELWRQLRGQPVAGFREDLLRQALARHVDFSPVFFLSTGRAGTLFFTDLLRADPHLRVEHNPYPELIVPSRVLYETLPADCTDPALLRLAGEIFLTARQQVLAQCFAGQQVYIETNNRITFFAPALLALFPRARFVHLYRHPVALVRSGLARRWYSGRNDHDVGRIVPGPGSAAADAWADWSDIERIAWLWAETGSWIERFLERVPAQQQLRIYFDKPDVATVKRVLTFCGAAVPADLAARVTVPRNAQPLDAVPAWAAWPAADQAALRRLAGPLAERLGVAI